MRLTYFLVLAALAMGSVRPVFGHEQAGNAQAGNDVAAASAGAEQARQIFIKKAAEVDKAEKDLETAHMELNSAAKSDGATDKNLQPFIDKKNPLKLN